MIGYIGKTEPYKACRNLVFENKAINDRRRGGQSNFLLVRLPGSYLDSFASFQLYVVPVAVGVKLIFNASC